MIPSDGSPGLACPVTNMARVEDHDTDRRFDASLVECLSQSNLTRLLYIMHALESSLVPPERHAIT